MTKLPVLTGPQVISALAKHGFFEDRCKGSHHQLKKDGHRLIVTVSYHGNTPLKRGTLGGILRTAGLTDDEFIESLNK